MLKCKQVTEMCSRELEAPLALREKVGLRTHLMMCSGCRNFRKQMEMLRHMMKSYADGKAVSEDPDAGRHDQVR